MPINTDAAALEAMYGGATGAVQPPPMQDLYAPDVRPEHKTVPTRQSQIPHGTPVPEGQFISQTVGRGMSVVPPRREQPNQPAIAVIPPQQSGRTTIGTFVETNPPPVTASTTNPLVVEPPTPVRAVEQPKKELDLTQEILTHIWELGGEKGEEAQSFYERGQQTLASWVRNPATIPLGAVIKFLNRKPGIKEAVLEQVKVHFEANGTSITSLPNRGREDVLICTPVMERMTVPYSTMLGVLCKRYELGFTKHGDTMINRSRNQLAKRFLDSGCKWSLWIDSDIAAPIGHADWYRSVVIPTHVPEESLNFEVLARLKSHGKPIVGAVYASRQWHGKLVIQPEIHPRSHEDKLLCNDIRRGSAHGLAAVEWIGFGCALIHREVFLEIQRVCRDEIAPLNEMAPWRFFQTVGDEGEDEAFCVRARRCGIPIWLDTQLICGHVGSMAFLPEHTLSLAAV